MAPIQPDLAWYKKRSEESKFTEAVRCPFASEQLCPRYWRSVHEADWKKGGDYSLEKFNELNEKWRQNPSWPRARETGIVWWGDDGNEEPCEYKDFCPEITLNQFGFAASSLRVYSTKERNEIHARLNEEKAPQGDWRWAWSALTPMHYTECPLYSMLTNTREPPAPREIGKGSYSKPDSHLYALIGPDDFHRLTNAEIETRHLDRARRVLKRDFIGEAFRSSLNRIRRYHGFPQSIEVGRKSRA